MSCSRCVFFFISSWMAGVSFSSGALRNSLINDFNLISASEGAATAGAKPVLSGAAVSVATAVGAIWLAGA
jgi:hypothetical protein